MLSSPLFLPPLRLRLLLVGCALAVVSLLYLPLPLLPSLTEQYGQQATRLVSFYGFSYAIGFLVFGPLSDYVGRQRIMVMGLALLSVVTLAMVVAPTFELLLLGRGIQGFIAASFPPVVIAYLAERGSVSDRTWGVALLSTAALLAGVVGQIYGLSVAASGCLTLSLLPLCLIYLITALALSKVPNERMAHSPQDKFFHQYRFITQIAVVAAPERRGLAIALYTFFLFVGAGLGPVLVHSIINLSLGKSYALLASLMALATTYATWGFLIKRNQVS